ncbi:MAG: NotI family restriction endonuclease [Nitrospirota bacterium]
MTTHRGNRPAEIFGYHFSDISIEAAQARKNRWCPFIERLCSKRSRLIDYPFGVCTAEHGGDYYTVCPHRFEEKGTTEGLPLVLENIAIHYFGDLTNLLLFSEVRLPNIGTIDFVLVRHKPVKAEVDDFIPVEFQSDSTTGTGALVQGLKDFIVGDDILDRTYNFGINTYDTIKRSITQLFNKGIVYEDWGIKSYWVIQEYIYANLVKRYGLKQEGYSDQHASRFALHEFSLEDNNLSLHPTRFVSVSVDEIYQAMRNNPGLPGKGQFVASLNEKLRARLSLKFN